MPARARRPRAPPRPGAQCRAPHASALLGHPIFAAEAAGHLVIVRASARASFRCVLRPRHPGPVRSVHAGQHVPVRLFYRHHGMLQASSPTHLGSFKSAGSLAPSIQEAHIPSLAAAAGRRQQQRGGARARGAAARAGAAPRRSAAARAAARWPPWPRPRPRRRPRPRCRPYPPACATPRSARPPPCPPAGGRGSQRPAPPRLACQGGQVTRRRQAAAVPLQHEALL